VRTGRWGGQTSIKASAARGKGAVVYNP
jgi:hypothetical protein